MGLFDFGGDGGGFDYGYGQGGPGDMADMDFSSGFVMPPLDLSVPESEMGGGWETGLSGWGGPGGNEAYGDVAGLGGPFASERGAGIEYDTTAGKLYQPTGQTIEEMTGTPGGGGYGEQRAGERGAGGPWLPPSINAMPGEPGAGPSGPAGAAGMTNPAGTGTPGGGGHWWDALGGKEGILGALGGSAGIMRALAGLGIGAAGMVVARGIAGPAPTLRPATATPTPLTAARTARQISAEEMQAGPEQAIRMQALGMMPGLMQPTAADEVRAALQRELMGVLSGEGGVSPATAHRQQQEEQIQRAQLQRQLGNDYELTTPGIQALNEMRRRHNEEKYTERQATIARISPLEESRLSGMDMRRRAALGDTSGLTRMGYTNVNPEEINLYNAGQQGRAGEIGYLGKVREREGLMQGIGGLFGKAAGTVTQAPSPYEKAITDMLNKQLGTGTAKKPEETYPPTPGF